MSNAALKHPAGLDNPPPVLRLHQQFVPHFVIIRSAWQAHVIPPDLSGERNVAAQEASLRVQRPFDLVLLRRIRIADLVHTPRQRGAAHVHHIRRIVVILRAEPFQLEIPRDR